VKRERQPGRGAALGGLYGNIITTLVNVRDTHPDGNYDQRDLEKETLIFERDDSMLVALSNRLDSGFDSRTVHTAFAPGTPLIEALARTGPFADRSAHTWVATVNYGDGASVPLALNADKTFALSHLYRAPGDHSVTVTVSDDDGTSGQARFVVHLPAPPQVRSVTINDGSAQRSKVDSMTVGFSTRANLAAGAFTLSGTFHGVTSDVSALVTYTTSLTADGRTVAVLKFAGAGVVGGSLPDGRYVLTVHAADVTDARGGQLAGDHVDRFFRLFGDADGGGSVGLRDLLAFARAYRSRQGAANYVWYFDYDNNGRIEARDFFQFLRRFGTSV
jgi:hypothetical protein